MPIFEFVDSEDPTARTKAKSHVARKAHRERRLREIEAYQRSVQAAPRSLQPPGQASTSNPDVPQLEQPVVQQVRQGVLLPQHKKSETTKATPKDESGLSSETTTIESSSEEITNPSMWIDTYASRVAARPQDSFWRTYSQLSTGDRNLLQWYLVTVPEFTFGIAHTAKTNPMRDWVFPLVGENSAILNSSLLIGAVNNPAFFHGEQGVNRVLAQKGKTINLINQALQSGQTAVKDDIMYAVAATALAEDRLGNHASCRTHLDGLKHMIRLRGGIKSLRKNSTLCAAIAWAEVSVSNYATPLQDSNKTPHGAKVSTLSMLEARHEQEIFCHFLTRLQKVQLSRRRNYISVGHPSQEKPDLLFRKGSTLLTILGDSDLDSGIITPISRMNANNCQLACLFYINFMLCEFHGFPQLTTAFLARLSLLVQQHSHNKVPRASLFVWVFVREIDQDHSGISDVDRLEWLIRMIRVARRLTPGSSQMLHHAMLESLKIHEPLDAGVRVSNDLGILVSRVEMGRF